MDAVLQKNGTEMKRGLNEEYGSLDDSALLACIGGQRDPEALKMLMKRHLPLISRTSYRILCDRPDSEVVALRTFVRVWKEAAQYDGRLSVPVWLCRITCRICHNLLLFRHLQRLLSVQPALFETTPPQAETAAEDYATKESWEIFCRVSRKLTARQRIVFALRELEGFTVGETAAITGILPFMIERSLANARSKVKSELERYGQIRRIH